MGKDLTTEATESTEGATPETDAFSVKFKSVCGSKAWVPTDICRRFERERDEAREHLSASNHFLEKYIAERDEAREDLEEEKKFHHRTHGELVQTQCKLLDAQAFIEELVDLVAYGLGQDASTWSQSAMRKAREVIAKAKSWEARP